MERSARLFRINRSQAVRLPKEFRFEGSEVFLRRDGDAVILSARPGDWSGFLGSEAAASDGFMAWVEELPVRDGGY
jgi:antitoxin VapB